MDLYILRICDRNDGKVIYEREGMLVCYVVEA